MKYLLLLKVFQVFILGSFCQEKEDTISISGSSDYLVLNSKSGLGQLKGLSNGRSAFTQKKFSQFLGIPYAQPPIGSLRFNGPKQFNYSRSDSEAIDATKFGSQCPQLNWESSEVVGSEDCLFLNIFTSNFESKLPVIVWIHGGSFQGESGELYGPEYLMEEPLVLVTFNYRLGILGFLQGNCGLKDQNLVLHWVQKHIGDFGGNPEKVTLMGVNSGGVSVHLHMLSPMSRGLFHRAVSQSGTALNPWAIVPKETLKSRLLKLSKDLDCFSNETNTDIQNEKEMIDCLRGRSIKEIVDAQFGFYQWYIDPLVPFGPIIEKLNGKLADDDVETFLPDSPYRLISQGKFAKNIPWILGINAQEGLLHSADIINTGMLRHVLNLEWEDASPITLQFQTTSIDPQSISKAIWDFYFNSSKIGLGTLEQLTQMYSDRYFNVGTHHAARLHVSQSQPSNSLVYLYYFNYKGQSTIVNYRPESHMIDYGISHYDNLQFLFKMPYFIPAIEPGHRDEKFSRNYIKTFARFAEFGNLNNWHPVTLAEAEGQDQLLYNLHDFNNIGIKTEVKSETLIEPFTQQVKFWDKLLLLEMHREIDTIIENYEKQNKDEL